MGQDLGGNLVNIRTGSTVHGRLAFIAMGVASTAGDE